MGWARANDLYRVANYGVPRAAQSRANGASYNPLPTHPPPQIPASHPILLPIHLPRPHVSLSSHSQNGVLHTEKAVGFIKEIANSTGSAHLQI